MFIVFEGLDGVGKTTQLKLLEKHLLKQNKNVIATREPGFCPFIRNAILDKNTRFTPESEMLLFLADRIEHWTQCIQPALEKDIIILCDRFKLSTLAYQGYGKGISIELIESLHETFLKNAQPDIVFLFNAPITVTEERMNREKDRMEDTSDTFKQRVQKGFLELAKKQKNVYIIDAQNDPMLIHQEILSILKDIT